MDHVERVILHIIYIIFLINMKEARSSLWFIAPDFLQFP